MEKDGGGSDFVGIKPYLLFLVVVVLVICGIVLKNMSSVSAIGRLSSPTKIGTRRMEPAGDPPHEHTVVLDGSGNGESSYNQHHAHMVERTIDKGLGVGGNILNHTHNISEDIISTKRTL